MPELFIHKVGMYIIHSYLVYKQFYSVNMQNYDEF